MGRLPLEGIRITDFSWIGAGSYATKVLADLGADVIKIESHKAIDQLRGLRQQIVRQDCGIGQDHAFDRGMRDVALVPQRHILKRGLHVRETADAHRTHVSSSRLRILPDAVIGRLSRNSMLRGYL